MSTTIDSTTEQHIKTYTRWLNIQLAKHNPPQVIDDIAQDFRNGKYIKI